MNHYWSTEKNHMYIKRFHRNVILKTSCISISLDSKRVYWRVTSTIPCPWIKKNDFIHFIRPLSDEGMYLVAALVEMCKGNRATCHWVVK